MNLQPINDQVVVKPSSQEEITKSGIVLPDTARKDRPVQGEVVAVGPGRQIKNGERMPMSVKPGDKVVFKKYSTDEIKIDEEEYLVVTESDIVAVILES